MYCSKTESMVLGECWHSNTMFRVHKLIKMLREYYKHDVSILEKVVTTKTVVEDEVHAMLHLRYRIRIRHEHNGSIEVKHLFAKITPTLFLNLTAIKTLDLMMRFKKEIYAYQVMIPEFDKFQKEKSRRTINKCDTFSNIFPICYGARCSIKESQEPDNEAAIVLEDLAEQNYVDISFREGIDLETMKTILRVLARYHATTLAYKFFNPEGFKTIIEPGLTITNVTPESYVCIPSEVDYIKKHIIKTQMKERLAEIDEVLKYSIRHMAQPPNNSWVGVCHGKFMLYNVMRRDFDVPKLMEFKFIDLQHQVKRHVLCDVVLFLMTSCPPGFTKEQCDIALYYYHEELFNHLMRYEGISIDQFGPAEFARELKETFRREFLRGLQMLRFICCKPVNKEKIRALSTWPRYDLKEVETCLDYNLYYKRLTQILVNIFDNNMFNL